MAQALLDPSSTCVGDTKQFSWKFLLEEATAARTDVTAWIQLPFASLLLTIFGLSLNSSVVSRLILNWNRFLSGAWRIVLDRFMAPEPLVLSQLSYVTVACAIYAFGVKRKHCRLDLSWARPYVKGAVWTASFLLPIAILNTARPPALTQRLITWESIAVPVLLLAISYGTFGRKIDLFVPFERFGKGIASSLTMIILVIAIALMADRMNYGINVLDNVAYKGLAIGDVRVVALLMPVMMLLMSLAGAAALYVLLFVIYMTCSYLRSLIGLLAAVIIIIALDNTFVYFKAMWDAISRSAGM